MHKRFLNLLAVQLLVLFFVAFKFFTPSHTYASELIGTHLGEGDVGYQINIIRNVLIPNGLEPGSPVTVMVPVTMLQSSQIGTVQELANAVNAGGFFPIVRINGVCENFSSETGNDAAASVDLARGVFGSNALIVWGNEINNQDNECNNWQKYLQDYIQIEGRPNVSTAALDYYMGNPAFTVDKMFADTPGMEAIYDSAPRAANAYGCVGSNSSNCYPVESGPNGEPPTNTQQIGYQAINGPVYLTEFSLSPEGNSSDAPDTDIKKVLEFIANRAGETGAQKITPLVRNVCNNDSDWLIYINGKLFTPQGNEVGENCVGRSGGSGYDLSIYPFYDVDETKFYLSPIRSLINGGTPDRTVENIRKELAAQGYESYCAAENVVIEPTYNTQALISRYLELYPDDIQVLEVDAVESLSTMNAQYPLWRDVSNKQFLLSSLEEYFGFKDVYEPDSADSVLTSSPLNSLLSEPQMCTQGWQNLVAQELACERLADPGSCELFTRPIPGTTYTVKTLLDDLKKYEPNYREGMARKGCQNLIDKDRRANATLFKGLINTPTYFDRAYRYGFIVAVIHTKDPGTASGNVASKIFNFFTGRTRTQAPRDEVLAVAFKLPDIATNKGGGDDAGSQFWSDPLDVTRKLLTTRKDQIEHEDVQRDISRKIILQNAIAAANQTESSKIYCYDGPFPGGSGSVSCHNKMTKALTDLINGNAQGCGDTEAVSVIRDIAGLDNPEEPYGKVFNSDNGGEVMLNLFVGDLTHPNAGGGSQKDPQRATTDDPAEKLKSLFTISKDTWNPEVGSTTIDFYVVYPMGFELKAVEDAMKGAFFTKAQLATLEQQQTIDGFGMTGQSMSLSATSDGFEYEDHEATARGECGTEVASPSGAIINKPCFKDVSVSVEQEDASVGILGARMGFWMKQVQKQLNSRATQAWEYFDSCKTTEEFMLGKCSGGNLSGQSGNTGDGSQQTPGNELQSVAQCDGGPRITTGETADHVETEGTGACSDKLTRLFVEDIHDIPDWSNPDDPVIDCNFLYSYADCSYPNSLVQNPVNSEGKFVQSGNITACEYVVSKSKELGVSPRLALAMWGEESGFSHFRVADLGVISQPAQDLGAQVTAFANTLNSYSNYIDFLEAYSGEERGANDPSPNQFCNNPHFVGRLKTYYDFLAPR